jgi:hypothetical protein
VFVELVGGLFGVGHFFPNFTHVLLALLHSFSSVQQMPVPALTHSLSGQRLPPVHMASFVQLALIFAVSLGPKGRQWSTTKLDEHRRALSPVLPAQYLMHRFLQMNLGLVSRRSRPSSSYSSNPKMLESFERRQIRRCRCEI